jgi:hypothetical protein
MGLQGNHSCTPCFSPLSETPQLLSLGPDLSALLDVGGDDQMVPLAQAGLGVFGKDSGNKVCFCAELVPVSNLGT